METYYTKKEYNEMKSILNRKLKAAEKKIKSLEQKIHDLEYPLEVTVDLEEEPTEEETHVTEE
jgi:prefoldin subunit 5